MLFIKEWSPVFNNIACVAGGISRASAFVCGNEVVNASSEAMRGLVKSWVEFPPAQIRGYFLNRPFPSSLVPLSQSESKCETILMKMTLIRMKMKLHAELIRFETKAKENSEMAYYVFTSAREFRIG